MLFYFLLASTLLSVSMAAPNMFKCQKWPNGTDTAVNWCDDVPTDGDIFSIEFVDPATGKDEFPIHLKKPINVIMDMSSNADHTDMSLDIIVYSWGGFAGCSWHKIPTFGLLSGLDACTNGLPCPVKKGRHTITVKLDFSTLASIIDLLPDDAPYQIHYQLTDTQTKKTACVVVQARCKTKA